MRPSKVQIKWILLALGIIGVFGIASYLSYREKNMQRQAYIDQKNYFLSLIEDKPVPLQQSFVESVKNRDKSNISISEAYFITHRFFDNGGNIYEIYDYIQSHPHLAFLNEAEQIYPLAFDAIKQGKAPDYSTRLTRHAYLAYMEVLDKHQMAGVAAWSTMANQYVRLAWLAKKHPEQFQSSPNLDLGEYYDTRAAKALSYASKVRMSVDSIMSGESLGDIPSRDIVVMLNQYGSTLRYMESLGFEFESQKTADQVFDFVSEYALQYAPEFYIYTGFLNATTMNMLSPHRKIAIEQVLQPLFNIKLTNKNVTAPSVANKIVRTKFEKYSYFRNTNILINDYETYSKSNIISLAQAAPMFKKWLMENGWEETDFYDGKKD